VGYEQSTTFKGKRRSSADLVPETGHRDGADPGHRARANRLLFDGHRLSGRIRQRWESHQAKATHEVVLTAGAFATPKLLIFQGSDPPITWPQFDIPVVADLPGVGQNLQDHNEVFCRFPTKGPLVFRRGRRIKLIRNVISITLCGPALSLPRDPRRWRSSIWTIPPGRPISNLLHCLMWPTLTVKPRNAVTLLANLVRRFPRVRPLESAPSRG